MIKACISILILVILLYFLNMLKENYQNIEKNFKISELLDYDESAPLFLYQEENIDSQNSTETTQILESFDDYDKQYEILFERKNVDDKDYNITIVGDPSYKNTSGNKYHIELKKPGIYKLNFSNFKTFYKDDGSFFNKASSTEKGINKTYKKIELNNKIINYVYFLGI